MYLKSTNPYFPIISKEKITSFISVFRARLKVFNIPLNDYDRKNREIIENDNSLFLKPPFQPTLLKENRSNSINCVIFFFVINS